MKDGVPANKWLVALSVSLGTLLATFSSSMLNIALPHLRGSLGVSLQEITWVITSFSTANICILPLTGFLSRKFGQKQVYVASLCVFLASSLLCGMTRSLPLLIILRIFQGAGAGALLPTEQALLQQTFPPSQQSTAIAIASMTVLLGPAMGPILGGLIVDNLSWQWIFFVNLPVGLLGLFMVLVFVQVPKDARESAPPGRVAPRGVDWSGILLLSLGLSGMQVLLAEGHHWGWSEPGTQGIALGVVFGLLAFVYRELTAEAPAVHLRLFTEPFFLLGTMLAGVLYAMLIASQYLFPIFMQEMLGFTATQAALTLISRVAVSAVATPLLGRYYNVLPPHLVLAVGTLAFGLSCLQMSTFTADTEASRISAAVAIQGLGFSGIGVTLTTLTLSRIPKHQKVDANGLHTLVRHTGGSLGLTFFAALLSRDTIVSRTALIPYISAGRSEVIEYLRAAEARLQAWGMDPGSVKPMAMTLLNNTVHRAAMMLAFERLFLLVGLLFLGALPLTLLLRQRVGSVRN